MARTLQLGVWALLCLALLALTTAAGKPPRPIIHDTDANNDDLMALTFLLKHPDIDVRAVSVVGTGWSDLGAGMTNIYGLLSLMGRNDIPVAAGAAYASYEVSSGEYGCTYAKVVPKTSLAMSDVALGTARWFPKPPLGRQYDPESPAAVDVMAGVINATGPIEILATGPLTNIDALFAKYPWTKDYVTRIYIMGGAVYVPGNIWWLTPNQYAEYNIYGDPDAAARVFASGVPITQVPLDASDTLPMTREFYDLVVGFTTTREAKYIAKLMEATKESSPNFFTGFYIWDPLAAAILTDEDAYAATTADLHLTVVTHLDTDEPGQMGRTKIQPDGTGSPVHVITSVNGNYYLDFSLWLNAGEQTAPPPQCYCPDVAEGVDYLVPIPGDGHRRPHHHHDGAGQGTHGRRSISV